MNVTGQDGNVISADFGKPDPANEPLFTVKVRMFYQDEHLVVVRLTYRIFGRELIQHVVKGAGLNV